MKHLLLLVLLFLTACSHHRSLRQTPNEWQVSAPKSSSEVAGWRVAEAAKSMVGKKQVQVKGKHFRRDCSGTVRGIYQAAGVDLSRAQSKVRENDSATLFRWLKKNGTIDDKAQLGDIVFFDNTYDMNKDGKQNDPLSHVGVVDSILKDGSVTFVHYTKGSIIRSHMNDMLRRRDRRHRGATGAQLLAGYGRL